jgi:hypothetical protein
LLRPFYDAFLPLLLEAVQAKVIKKQRLGLLYFMVINAVTMSLSYRHLLGYCESKSHDINQLKEEMTRFLIVNFLDEQQSLALKKGIQAKRRKSVMTD